MTHEKCSLEVHTPPYFCPVYDIRSLSEAASVAREAGGGAAASIEGEAERDTLRTEGEEEIFHDAAQEHGKEDADAAAAEKEEEEKEEASTARSVAVKIQQVPEDEVCWQTLRGTNTGCLFGRAAHILEHHRCGREILWILASKVMACLLVSRCIIVAVFGQICVAAKMVDCTSRLLVGRDPSGSRFPNTLS